MPPRAVSPSSPVRTTLLAGAVLGGLVVLAYLISLRGEFLWDDDLHISANPTIVGPLGLKEIWTSARALYFPLVLTNFWAQHQLWGLEPLGYRVVTLAFHVLAALLLWRVLRRLGVPGAWLGAALWALHPVQVESVAWICELKNTQSAVFFLAAAGCWLSWLERRGSGTAGAGRAYAAALGFALLAILSKPSTVMLPVALALMTWWRERRLGWRDVAVLAPFFALSALAAGWTIWEQKFNSGAIGEEWSQTLPERFAIAGRVAWFYLGKLVWPEPLIFIYPRWEIEGGNPWIYLGLIALLAVGGVLWRGRHGRLRPVAFAAAYFLVLLFPVLGFFNVYFFRYSFVGDHFQYLASMGPLALLGAAVAALPRRLALGAGAALVVALAGLTARHSLAFLEPEALWRHTVARNPAATMAWLNLGDTLARAGRHQESIATFRHALTLKPQDPYGWNDLACELVLAGRPEEAVPAFERALALKEDFAEAHNNFGNALRDLGRLEEAIVQQRRAVELDPAYAEAHNNLGTTLAQAGRTEEAVAAFERSLALRPGDAPTLDNLGSALRDLGRIDEAEARHREALRLRPGLVSAEANLGRALAARGRAQEALTHFEAAWAQNPRLAGLAVSYAGALMTLGRGDEAIERLRAAVAQAPESAEAQLNLGAALAQLGAVEEAVGHFERAIALAPGLAAAHENLGTALAAQQRWGAAAEAFTRAVEIDPQARSARRQLAVALVNDGRLADAVPHFRAALEDEPSSAELHENLGRVYGVLGKNREAFHHLEEAARLRRGSR